MDPVTLATVTSAVTVLAREAGRGLAGQAGKDIWSKVKDVLGWSEDPSTEDLAPKVATRLKDDDQAARQILRLLQEHQQTAGDAAIIVGNITAERLVWIQNQKAERDINITM